MGTTPWELETKGWRYVLQAEAAGAAEAAAANEQHKQEMARFRAGQLI